MKKIYVSEVDHELQTKVGDGGYIRDRNDQSAERNFLSALGKSNQVTALDLTYLDVSSVNPTLLENVCSKIFCLEL